MLRENIELSDAPVPNHCSGWEETLAIRQVISFAMIVENS